MNILDLINQEHFVRVLFFVIAAFFGMLYSYAYKWSESFSKSGLLAYLTCDSKSVTKAVCALLAATLGAGSLSYLDSLSISEIMIAGAGIGALIPGKLSTKETVNEPIQNASG